MSKTVEDIGTLKINLLSQAQYDAEKAGGRLADDELYLTPSSGTGVSDVEVNGESVVSGGVAEITINDIPSGGTTGQVLTKDSGTDYDVSWEDPSGGTITDVTVDGTSIVDDGVAELETVTQLRDGLMTATDKQKLDGIASGAEVNVQSNWSQSDSTADDYIKNKPTIPTVNNATLTIQKNGTTVDTFTANASSNVTANITVPTKVSDLNNDSGFVTTDEKLAISESNTAGNSWYPIIGSGTTAKARNYCGNFMFVIGSGVGALPTSIKLGNNQSGNSNSNRYGAIELYGTTEYKTELNSGSPSANRTISLPNNDGTVALTSDLPTVNNATLTIQKNGTTVNTFTANASSNVTANITVPTDTGDLTNGAGFITGVTSTSTPTASTIAEFDASAHMNSTDMTSAEVSDFVDDLNVSPINLIDMFYPIGSYYETSDSTFNPNITWGGTWVLETEGQVHVSAGENYEVGDTGGAETQSYPLGVNGGAAVRKYSTTFYFGDATTFEMPKAVSGSNQGYWVTSANSDSFSTAAPPATPFGGVRLYGNTESGNNMQPYIVVNRWHRTA